MVFRHNGLHVVILIGVISFLFSVNNRKIILMMVTLLITIYFFLNSVIYPRMNNKTEKTNGINPLLIHAISSHVDQNTPLLYEEETLIGTFLPLNQWVYDPCVINTLWNKPGGDQAVFYGKTTELIKMLIRLTVSSPSATFNYFRDSSRMIWQIQQGGCYLYRIGVMKNNEGSLVWIHEFSKLLPVILIWMLSYGVLRSIHISLYL